MDFEDLPEEWLADFKSLEEIRQTGSVNMFECAQIFDRKILAYWMDNYEALKDGGFLD